MNPMNPNPTIRRIVAGVPWLILAALAALYLVEAFRLAQSESVPWAVMLMGVLLGILLFFPLGLAVEVVEEKTLTGAIKPRARRLLYWTPRIAAILFCLFLSLFALDVFDMGLPWDQALFALLIHLLPVLVLAVGAVLIAWRWEWVGALVLIGWAVWYAVSRPGFTPMTYIVIVGLPFVLGVLFWLNWQFRSEIRAA